MLNKVIKRDGIEVDFDKNKIINAIEKSMLGTVKGVQNELIHRIADKLEEKYSNLEKVITVEEIQDEVENQLMASSRKDAAKEYIKYRHQRNVARQSKTRDMFLDIISTKANDVTRENANMNADTPAGMMMKFASEATKPFVKDYLFPQEVREAHEKGYIHIHDLDYYPSKSLTCLSGDTYITLKNKDSEIINTSISFFDSFFASENQHKWINIDDYRILGRNGWTKIKGVSRRKINENDIL